MHSFDEMLRPASVSGEGQTAGGGEGWRQKTNGVRTLLRDDLQDVEDELHDDGALAQLAGPAVDDGDQSAVQVAQVLREEGLPVTARQVTHL